LGFDQYSISYSNNKPKHKARNQTTNKNQDQHRIDQQHLHRIPSTLLTNKLPINAPMSDKHGEQGEVDVAKVVTSDEDNLHREDAPATEAEVTGPSRQPDAKVEDEMGDRVKAWEAASETNLDPSKPLVVRLDGCSFHTYARGFRKPCDPLIYQPMSLTTQDLVQKFNARSALSFYNCLH